MGWLGWCVGWLGWWLGWCGTGDWGARGGGGRLTAVGLLHPLADDGGRRARAHADAVRAVRHRGPVVAPGRARVRLRAPGGQPRAARQGSRAAVAAPGGEGDRPVRGPALGPLRPGHLARLWPWRRRRGPCAVSRRADGQHRQLRLRMVRADAARSARRVRRSVWRGHRAGGGLRQ